MLACGFFLQDLHGLQFITMLIFGVLSFTIIPISTFTVAFVSENTVMLA